MKPSRKRNHLTLSIKNETMTVLTELIQEYQKRSPVPEAAISRDAILAKLFREELARVKEAG